MTFECYNKRVLWVDLSTGEVDTEILEEEVYRKFIGGKGLGTYLLYKNVSMGVDPLGAENVIFFMTGPLQGLPAPNVGRWTLVTKSPLTGLFLDTHCGGSIGQAIKKAGYDALCVKGTSEKPVYLMIDDDSIEIRDASGLWGKGVYEATSLLHDEHGKSAVYTIGPAGENLVKIATGCCELAHQTGRGGAGAVMGAKKLKAVVVKGSKEIAAADVDRIRTINRSIIKEWNEADKPFKRHGTRFLVEVSNSLGQYPSWNWKNGYFDEYEKLDPVEMEEKWYTGAHHSCPHCVMRCTHAFTTVDPENTENEVESMPEYETLGLLAGNIGNSDPQWVLKLNYFCDDMGLDTISAGSVVGFAMEACEKGILTEKEIGFPLEFGDAEAAVRLLRLIVDRSGIGDVLAEGVKIASERIANGAQDIAVHVKGLETAAWDPRGRRGLGLSYATADVGSSHLRGWPATAEAPDEPAVELTDSMVEARFHKILTDSLEVCHFTYHLPLTLEQKVDLLNAATGLDYTVEDMYEFGKRVETLSRMFNVREGVSRKDDVLPTRFWEPQTHGPREGMVSFVSRNDFDASIDKYYEILGWGSDGIPKRETKRDLGLESI